MSLPDTPVVTLDGSQPASLADYRGRPLVINLWASWCTPCRTEMPAFEEVSQTVGSKVAIVGLTDDPDHDQARKTAGTAGVTYPLLVDTGERFQSDLKIVNLPATVFVDPDGKVLEVHAGALDAPSLRSKIGSLYGVD